MKQRLYSIYDMRSKSYGIPFVAVNDDIAKRTVASTLLSVPPTHLMYAFASDYELYYLGEVMENGSLVTAEDGAKAIAFLSDILQVYKINAKREVIADEFRKQNEPETVNAE